MHVLPPSPPALWSKVGVERAARSRIPAWDKKPASHPASFPGNLQVLPPWLTTIALSLLLAFLTNKLLQRGTAAHLKEGSQLGKEAAAARRREPPALPTLTSLPSMHSSGSNGGAGDIGNGGFGGAGAFVAGPYCVLPPYPVAGLAAAGYAVQSGSSAGMMLPMHTGPQAAGERLLCMRKQSARMLPRLST
jgi:hypothetical protein